MKNSSVALVVIFILLAIAASMATAHDPPRLVEYLANSEWTTDSLSADQAATLESIQSDPATTVLRIGQAFPNAVRNARALSIVVPAPQGVGTAVTVSFHDLEIDLRSEQDYSLYARDEASGSEVSLVVLGTDVLGTIRRDVDVYKVHPLGGGLTAVYRYDASRMEEGSRRDVEALEVQSRDAASSEDSDPPPSPPIASGDGVAVIDVLVVYTRRTRAEAGNIGALIRHTLDQTNRIYANSSIRARVRLAYSYQTDYAEVVDDEISIDFDRLRSTADRYMDEVHAVRERHGADLVVLLRGRHSRYWCQYANYFYDDSSVFSVVEHNCIGNYSLAQALALNQGASRDLQYRPNSRFPYGHAFCNDLGNWRTLMSWNPDRSCAVRQPYISNPDVSFMGSPTGDAHTRNNARVISETAPLIANYRQAPLLPHAVPLVTSADNESRQGFVRIINRSERTGTVQIHAIDDEGHRFVPIELSLDAKQTRHFNSKDLEDGNPTKGLSPWRRGRYRQLAAGARDGSRYRGPGVHPNTGRLFDQHHQVAVLSDDGSTRYHVPIFNPGKNADQQSRLRLVNPGDSAATNRDHRPRRQGRCTPGGQRASHAAGRSGPPPDRRGAGAGLGRVSGRFDVGSGKWQLFVSADQPIQVMSLLLSPTGNLTNLSP